jgi:ribosomal protein L37AE/L43A
MGKVSGVLSSMGFKMGQDQKRQILALDKEFETLLHLQAQVNPLQRDVERLKKQLDMAAKSAGESFTFDEKIGAYFDSATRLHYCAKCFHEERGRVPMKNAPGGWICKVCGKQYPNPSAEKQSASKALRSRPNFVTGWRR